MNTSRTIDALFSRVEIMSESKQMCNRYYVSKANRLIEKLKLDMKQSALRKLKLGDRVLRRRGSDKEPQWVETIVNETYLVLIRDFPEDYKPLAG